MMRKCTSAPQLAGNAGQLSVLSRVSSKGLPINTGGGGGSRRTGAAASCNSLTGLEQDDAESPRKATFAGHSLSSGSLSSLGSAPLGAAPHHGSACNLATFCGGTLSAGRRAVRGGGPPKAFLVDAPQPPKHTAQQELPFEQARNLAVLSFHNQKLMLAQEAGQWMLEGASHGISNMDCFELFGFPEDAPNLRDVDSPGADESRAQERQRKTAEAACLLTPATGQERDMGAQLHAAVRRAAVETEAETQARYAEEIRRQAATSWLEEVNLSSPAASRADKLSPRRRRRKEEELDAEVLKLIVRDTTIDGGGNTGGVGRHSPRTRDALAALHESGLPPHRNTLAMRGGDLPLASADMAASIDLPPQLVPGPPADSFVAVPNPPAGPSTHPTHGANAVLASSCPGEHEDVDSPFAAAAAASPATNAPAGGGEDTPRLQPRSASAPVAAPAAAQGAKGAAAHVGHASAPPQAPKEENATDAGRFSGPASRVGGRSGGAFSNAVPFMRPRSGKMASGQSSSD